MDQSLTVAPVAVLVPHPGSLDPPYADAVPESHPDVSPESNGYFFYVVLFLPVGLNSRCIVD